MENNWTIKQTKELFDLVYKSSEEKKGLMWAFGQMSSSSGKSINSVRNYYYSQLKIFSIVPNLASDLKIKLVGSKRGDFVLFNQDEIDNLIATILINKAKGQSVRATIAHLSNGDEKKALRLQNKYRSMVANQKHKVTNILRKLNENGEIYFNPYTKSVVSENDFLDNHKKLQDYISNLDENEIENFFVMMKKLFA